jgi:hypothetical protein
MESKLPVTRHRKQVEQHAPASESREPRQYAARKVHGPFECHRDFLSSLWKLMLSIRRNVGPLRVLTISNPPTTVTPEM